MYYYNQIKDKNNYIYSCDSIRLEIKVDILTLDKVCNFCSLNCYKSFMSHKSFSYKYCYTITLSEQVSFSVLCGLNTYGKIKSVFIIDFNPNKCMQFEEFSRFMSYIYNICYDFHKHRTMMKYVEIKRYDIAIDVPYTRSNVHLYWSGKGAKVHEVYQTTSSDRTDYYGERNSIGRLKIYNKSLEDFKKKSKQEKADYLKGCNNDVTRIEVTHNSFDTIEFYSALPVVYTSFDLCLLPHDITPIDYVLICSCRENSDYIYHLKQSRKKWNKLKQFIESEKVDFDLSCISDILYQIVSYKDFTTYFQSKFFASFNKHFKSTSNDFKSYSYFDPSEVDLEFITFELHPMDKNRKFKVDLNPILNKDGRIIGYRPKSKTKSYVSDDFIFNPDDDVLKETVPDAEKPF